MFTVNWRRVAAWCAAVTVVSTGALVAARRTTADSTAYPLTTVTKAQMEALGIEIQQSTTAVPVSAEAADAKARSLRPTGIRETVHVHMVTSWRPAIDGEVWVVSVQPPFGGRYDCSLSEAPSHTFYIMVIDARTGQWLHDFYAHRTRGPWPCQ